MSKRKFKIVQVKEGWAGKSWVKAREVLYWDDSMSIRSIHTMMIGNKMKVCKNDGPPQRLRITVEVEVEDVV